MSFTEAIKTVFSKYAVFSGRATRSEYWYFALFYFLIGIPLIVMTQMNAGLALLASIIRLALFLPSLGVFVRRMHDINFSGLRIFFALIPVVGWILLLVWLCKDSQPGENQYGPNPKGIEA